MIGSILVGWFIWRLFYYPHHDRMPWSYKKWVKKNGIVLNTRRKDWQ